MSSEIPEYDSQLAHIHDDKRPSTIAATCILIVASTLAVAGRITAHWMVQPRLLADDYCAIIALLMSLGLCATLIACVKYGLGIHVLAVMQSSPDPTQNLVNVFKTGFALALIAIPDLFFIKCSLLIFYRRIFTSARIFRITLYLVAGYVTAWTIATLIVFINRCHPVYLFWDRAYALAAMTPPTTGTCLPSISHNAAPAILNSVSDFLILVLPAVALWPLQMRRSKKFGLFFVFSLGAFVCGVSIVKIVYAFPINNSADSTYYNTEILLWTTVECCIGLVCACLPTMLPLVRLVMHGRKAAVKRDSPHGDAAVHMQNVRNAPKFPGGRRLHSFEDMGETIASDETKVSDKTARSINTTTTTITAHAKDDTVPVGGEIIPWDKSGQMAFKVRNEAVGGFTAPATDLPPNTIMVESQVELASEREREQSEVSL